MDRELLYCTTVLFFWTKEIINPASAELGEAAPHASSVAPPHKTTSNDNVRTNGHPVL